MCNKVNKLNRLLDIANTKSRLIILNQHLLNSSHYIKPRTIRRIYFRTLLTTRDLEINKSATSMSQASNLASKRSRTTICSGQIYPNFCHNNFYIHFLMVRHDQIADYSVFFCALWKSRSAVLVILKIIVCKYR